MIAVIDPKAKIQQSSNHKKKEKTSHQIIYKQILHLNPCPSSDDIHLKNCRIRYLMLSTRHRRRVQTTGQKINKSFQKMSKLWNCMTIFGITMRNAFK